MIKVEFFGSSNLDNFWSNPKRQKNLKKKQINGTIMYNV